MAEIVCHSPIYSKKIFHILRKDIRDRYDEIVIGTLCTLRCVHYIRLTFAKGINNPFYFYEELHGTAESPKNIIVSDRATLFNLIIEPDGYTISSGILSSDLNGTDIIAIPLQSSEIMEVGYIRSAERPLSKMAERYLELFQEYIEGYGK